MARLVPIAVAILSVAAIVLATARLMAAGAGVTTETITVGTTPATVFRPAAPDRQVADPPPVVVIAHGFAGSRTLMAPFATALAKNGYVAVTFDFLGHGENPLPLAGDVTEVDGATRALVAETGRVADRARALPDAGGGLALIGHSMASDIVVRFAKANPAVAATIAVSMFSPAVTAEAPKNLLVIVGEWEGMLAAEALRAVGLATGGAAPEEGVTYGSFADGTARRAVLSDNAEHIAVLYRQESLAEAVRWLDRTFGIDRAGPVATSGRLGPVALLFAGIVALGWPLSRLLPVVVRPSAGAGLAWRRLLPVILVPTLVTPLALRVLPTDFLPVVVGDYLAVHFFVFGALTAVTAWWFRDPPGTARSVGAAASTGTALGASSGSAVRIGALAAATLAVTVYGLGALGLAIDSTITSFEPTRPRLPLFAAMLAGTLVYFLTNEWVSRGAGAPRLGYLTAKVGFVVSLAIAVALDFERLFFLIIIVPVIVIFFIIYGLFSDWSYRRTGHPVPAAVANALVFAWAITVTFPMLAG